MQTIQSSETSQVIALQLDECCVHYAVREPMVLACTPSWAFYFSFAACPAIVNCYETQCTRVFDNKCVFCHGEVKDEQYFRAYTKAPSLGKACQSMSNLQNYSFLYLKLLRYDKTLIVIILCKDLYSSL